MTSYSMDSNCVGLCILMRWYANDWALKVLHMLEHLMHLDVVHQTLQNVSAPIASPDLRGLSHDPPVKWGCRCSTKAEEGAVVVSISPFVSCHVMSSSVL